MEDWNLDEKSLGKWQQLQQYNSIIPHKIYNKWTKNVGFTFCVGDAINDRGEATASVISADGFPLMVGPNFQPSDGNPTVI